MRWQTTGQRGGMTGSEREEMVLARRGGNRVLTTVELCLALLVLFSYGSFYNAVNWNDISRLDAIFSLVEADTPDQYSLRISHFIVDPVMGRNTGDWARNDALGEDFYSNKAPGLMMLGVPVYAVLYHAQRTFGVVPESQRWTRINSYLLNLWLSVFPAAFAAVLFLRWLRSRFELVLGEALALTLLLFFCTFLFPYATQLWGHVSAASFIVAALYFLDREDASAAWSGLFVGIAVLSEYSAAISLLSMVCLLAVERRWKTLLYHGLGGLPAFLVYGVYHWKAFGSWLSVASAFNNPKFTEVDRVAGIFGGPEIDALWGLSFSPHHGLFFFVPMLLAVIPACLVLGRGPGRSLRWLALGNVVGFWLMNLLFNGWHGGFCLGPRYLIPSLPFYVVLMVPLLKEWRGGGVVRFVACALITVSAANMALLAARAPSASIFEQRSRNPMATFYRMLASGELGEQRLSPLRLDGEWLSQGRVLVSRNGTLAWDPASTSEAGEFRATSSLRTKEPEMVRFHVGWQGSLRFRVNGALVETPFHAAFAQEMLSLKLQAGENALSVSLPETSTPRLSMIALASMGRPRLPRATAEMPEFSVSGANLGHLLGLSGVASLLPLLAGAGGLLLMLRRSARAEQ